VNWFERLCRQHFTGWPEICTSKMLRRSLMISQAPLEATVKPKCTGGIAEPTSAAPRGESDADEAQAEGRTEIAVLIAKEILQCAQTCP
jgi:hypothetical protein